MHDPGPAFRALHQPGTPFVLANAWDIGSARMLAALGAQAIGTSSAAFAFTLGKPDGQVTRDEALAHAESIVAATELPVSGDFENGYGDDPDTVAETVRLACEAGLAGLSIEDTLSGATGSYERDLAVERIRAAASAARSLPRDFMLVARADGVMLDTYDIEEALARLAGFEEAGADCLYVPAPPSFEDLQRICESTTLPVNALTVGTLASYTLEDFARIGVARISLGSSLARVTHRAIIDAMSEVFEDGSFSRLKKSVSGGEIDQMLIAGATKA
ncbi:isocitrate lyase/phosphoenolpyruvate mutase family protein [Pseudooceanicola sediminis]|uniref:Isocitrate lyase/phosphoenolpyruvate mutase family protein n=1 Tax=Pseudooceanicola sediminis TaxID=2211117 RepID=A0A399J353_9RHOB|nr:isocitrate lyase/phosphoenolpyruvate mutase family protein [Pseudooceanicola sediminis]KAA2317393.1 isocitrate lyase/phosphoenolpyruvate mutase family protein [Puniceibacterium sp. HSS470]RII39745.1 isocitrate lyase/phosphoenolpyruvate mutase family protein [Pseudooceanicola sediminis]|tara:strand:+ start:17182 stop:18006 length:825 start_codon:yes stop_codon:yes gene_type:complete